MLFARTAVGVPPKWRGLFLMYQPNVSPCVQYAVLPSTLSGSYTLILSDDTYLFTGYVNL